MRPEVGRRSPRLPSWLTWTSTCHPTITPTGSVGGIGGIQEKIAAAEEAGATAFLVPAANCDDLDGVRTDVTLVRVATLNEAIAAVETLNASGGAGTVPQC